MKQKTIVFADDHSLISEMWGELIKNTGQFTIEANRGVNGYITKTAGFDEIMKAITIILDGKSYMSYEVQQRITNQFTDTGSSIEQLLSTLTRQEMKICKLIYKGLSSKEIADDLSISVKTVQIHRHNIYKKLDIHKLSQLMLIVQDHQSFFDTE